MPSIHVIDIVRIPRVHRGGNLKFDWVIQIGGNLRTGLLHIFLLTVCKIKSRIHGQWYAFKNFIDVVRIPRVHRLVDLVVAPNLISSEEIGLVILVENHRGVYPVKICWKSKV